MDKELTTLIGRLQDNSKGCEEKCLDFQALKFEAKESEMRLFTPSRSYFFKSDPPSTGFDPRKHWMKPHFSGKVTHVLQNRTPDSGHKMRDSPQEKW